MTPDALFVLGAALIGLAIGSFLNVLIHRLPKMMEADWREHCAELEGRESPPRGRYNLFLPHSHCQACKTPIRSLDNVPVVSWLLLRGRCRQCDARISARYPIVEALTGALSVGVALKFGLGWPGAFAIVFVWLLIALTFIDIDTQLLPVELTSWLFWLGLLAALLGLFPLVSLRDSVIGAVAGHFSLWFINATYRLARGRDGMGGGDFALLSALGAWMGWQALLPIVLIASLVGGVVGVAQNLLARRGIGLEVAIPFGPYLAGAGVIVLFTGDRLLRLLIPI